MSDERSFNPFKDLSGDDVQRYLRELTDEELIDHLNVVSNDLKRRNSLLPRPDSENAGADAVRGIVDVLFPDGKAPGA